MRVRENVLPTARVRGLQMFSVAVSRSWFLSWVSPGRGGGRQPASQLASQPAGKICEIREICKICKTFETCEIREFREIHVLLIHLVSC